MLDAERFLSEIEPFKYLDSKDIKNLAYSLLVDYRKKGEVIFEHGSKPLDFLYILRKGGVVLEKGGEVLEYLHEGESFGFVSLMTSEPPTSTAKTVEDSVLFLLNKKLFNQLLSKSEPFREFYVRKLARRLQEAKRTKTHEQYTSLVLEDINLRPLIVLDWSESVDKAVKEMVSKDSTFILVRLKDGLGIVTERDVLKKVIAKGLNPLEVRLEEVASYPLVSIESSSQLYDAILLMAKHGIRKLLVTKGGTPVGILEDRDIIAYESKNAVVLIKEIDKARTVEDLRYIYNLVRGQTIDLVLQGTDPERLSAYISELNDRFMKRAVYLAMSRLGEEPLVPFSIMVLGSEGRREQSLKTDQDNALIYEDYPMLDFNPKEYFQRFSEVYIDVLLEIGFPPCPGKVMVSNPFWRRSSHEWEMAIKSWIEKPQPENMLNVAIFFDFRNVFGDQTLVDRLWYHILQRLKENPGFFPFLALDAVRFKPPLGFFKDFVVERSGEHRGELDIKKGGIFPLTQGVRALSLEHGIGERSTFKRIEELQKLGVFSKEYGKDLSEAYRFLMGLRLRVQAEKIRDGKEADNYVNPNNLSKAEKGMLKDVFRLIREFQDMLYERYSLHVFG
ncbi:MAG: cyclic nucleotide-binding/CBS domain-containing protein [Acidobacteria bacterium]|jgi:CBS domain-containing protein|nr:MAG: cyclic nucleotide-binding/CBS domain-containing protein [Acidobacteriota bacterium]